MGLFILNFIDEVFDHLLFFRLFYQCHLLLWSLEGLLHLLLRVINTAPRTTLGLFPELVVALVVERLLHLGQLWHDHLAEGRVHDPLGQGHDLLRDARAQGELAHGVSEVIAVVGEHVLALVGPLRTVEAEEFLELLQRKDCPSQQLSPHGPSEGGATRGVRADAVALVPLNVVDDDSGVIDCFQFEAKEAPGEIFCHSV